MRVLLFTRYGRMGASSRVRSLQYLPYLRSVGIEVDVCPLLSDAYVRGLYAGNIPIESVVTGYLSRVASLFGCRKYDLLWIEKELLPWIPDWLEKLLLPRRTPYIVDYDDALFHRYELHRRSLVRYLLGDKIDRIMAGATLVLAGNPYINARAVEAGAEWVEILPTVVDLARYQCLERKSGDEVVVGWIGSPGTAHYLASIRSVIEEAAQKRGIRFRAVGALGAHVAPPIEAVGWSEESEVSNIQEFDIGIMPLPDSPFERGKCGYKLIQYMACGKPVIASPIGVNRSIVEHGWNGFFADKAAEWSNAIDRLCLDPSLRHKVGRCGREKVEQFYSLQVMAPRLGELLLRAAMR